MKLYLYVSYKTGYCDDINSISYIREFDFTNEEDKKNLEKEWVDHQKRTTDEEKTEFRLFQGVELEIIEKQIQTVQYELKVKDEAQ